MFKESLEALLIASNLFSTQPNLPSEQYLVQHRSPQVYVQTPKSEAVDRCKSSSTDAEVRKLFNIGKKYYERAEKSYDANHYEVAVKYFDSILKLCPSEYLRREALFYSARALWYGISDKKPKEAEKRFEEVIKYNIKDNKTGYSIFSVGLINFEHAEFDERFNIDIAEEMFNIYKQQYPKGHRLKVVEERLRKISKIRSRINTIKNSNPQKTK